MLFPIYPLGGLSLIGWLVVKGNASTYSRYPEEKRSLSYRFLDIVNHQHSSPPNHWMMLGGDL